MSWIKVLHYLNITSLTLHEADLEEVNISLKSHLNILEKLDNLIDLRREEAIHLNQEIEDMKLRIENLRASFNLKMEEITKVPITNQQPISLRPPSWKRYQRDLENQSYVRAAQMRREIADDVIARGGPK